MIDRLEDGNAFLRAALGLVSLGAAMDRVLDRFAPAFVTTNGSEDVEDAMLFAVLGAIALKDQVSRELASMADQATRTPVPAPSGLEEEGGTVRMGLLR